MPATELKIRPLMRPSGAARSCAFRNTFIKAFAEGATAASAAPPSRDASLARRLRPAAGGAVETPVPP